MILAAELHAIGAAVKNRAGRERAVGAFVAFRCRRWAAAIERLDRAAIIDALELARDATRRAGYGFELRAYADAVDVLRRALRAADASQEILAERVCASCPQGSERERSTGGLAPAAHAPGPRLSAPGETTPSAEPPPRDHPHQEQRH